MADARAATTILQLHRPIRLCIVVAALLLPLPAGNASAMQIYDDFMGLRYHFPFIIQRFWLSPALLLL